MSEEVLGDLKLALTEACSNSVRHTYGGGEGLVEIVYELCPDRLIVEVAPRATASASTNARRAGART